MARKSQTSPPSRGRSLSALSLTDLHTEISRRQRRAKGLLRKRSKLETKLRTLDAEIATLGLNGALASKGGGGGGTRFHNEMSLADSLAEALKGKTLSVGEAMEAVQRAGYRTTSHHFRVQVNIALTKDSRFKRVSRGQYTVK
jgi:hypothetical protein